MESRYRISVRLIVDDDTPEGETVEYFTTGWALFLLVNPIYQVLRTLLEMRWAYGGTK